MDSQNNYAKMSSYIEIFDSLNKKIEKCSKKTKELANKIIDSIKKKDLNLLKKICLSGLPDDLPMLRALVWKINLGYLPINVDEWSEILQKQREEYHYYKEIYIKMKKDEYENKTYKHEDLFCLIAKDINRTYSQFNFFFLPTSKDVNIPADKLNEIMLERQCCSFGKMEQIYKLDAIETHAEILERILFVYSQLAPDLSYRQGMNELLAPIYYTFCYDKNFNEETLENVEADSFWVFFKLMKGLASSFDQDDNFNTHIKSEILEQALFIIDEDLSNHLKEAELTFNMFCYKWFILLLSQDFSVNDVFRLWDIFFVAENKYYYVFYACLAIFELKRSKLMELNELHEILVEIKNFGSIEVENLIKVMFELIKQYEKELAIMFYPPKE